MKPKPKNETESPLRTPQPKKKLGLKVRQIAMPHDGLIFPENPDNPEKPKLELVPVTENSEIQSTVPSLTTQTSESSQSSQTGMSSQTRHTKSKSEIAPSKNYHKVSNTITRQAIPEGLFQGKSKQLYDVLYALTRGALIPKREIRISKTKLMKQAGIGSRITFDACVSRLEAVGLLVITVFAGEHDGNAFEVLLPEEIETLTRQSSQTSRSSLSSPAQKPDRLLIPESSQTSQSLNKDDTTTYGDSKTFFKTSFKTGDDEFALDELATVFEETSRKYTGKSLSKNDREKWRELAELLATEFGIAAARTKSISSVPAFLTAHLRRRLFSGNPTFKSKEMSPSLRVGAPPVSPIDENNEPKPLAAEEKEAVLEHLRKSADWFYFENEFTAEDWTWLKEQLERQKEEH